jgi:alcohol dehydrogenase class IV
MVKRTKAVSSSAMRFEFGTATRIVFGRGTLKEVAAGAREFGQRALIVTGRTAARARALESLLAASGLACWTMTIPGEPEIADVEDGARAAREQRIDLVIAIGGGSAIDGGKAIAALATNPGDALDYLEVIGRGKPLAQPGLPFIAIPTTAGTGAEVTRNAVLASREHRVKVSLRSPLMLPKLAVVDPELTLGLPAALTASTGLDALTQLIEPFVSCRANPITDALCREGIPRIARSLRCACSNPDDIDAREDMALASLLSGLALANAGLGAVHGFAGPIGGMFPAPHGAICAALLAPVMEINLRALHSREPEHPALDRYTEIARLLTGHATALAVEGVRWVRDLCAALEIPPLRQYGVKRADFPTLCEKTARSSSMKGNPAPLEIEELSDALDLAL